MDLFLRAVSYILDRIVCSLFNRKKEFAFSDRYFEEYIDSLPWGAPQIVTYMKKFLKISLEEVCTFAQEISPAFRILNQIIKDSPLVLLYRVCIDPYTSLTQQRELDIQFCSDLKHIYSNIL